ncbi:T6SS protein Cts1W [Erwinia sp. OLTSP20]|uniref:DcrB-related protein n=1 Tax=unclassified Erwinia TaxID=2622719 RepID=UPI000C18D5A9|nr:MULTISPECIES: DcrB-related protein [unclassified Erwinia]PIJ49601.1 T6SS protein Cts1W [Erwinia sp. OAMSP11]PIJ71597.1 T6SS protein Cts1W [Erwinia sp. OLSSP12]PIJ82667.1 T6SS protein Cts1W [Erwinia sp. OLCASP19]PIJ83134.1 T6SS protein Cts1W [Erwinia sp. OLMTSP26]PIJ85300.1 T6SS protein Cts1W [Erwinia sp. OLMDSP33]
MSKSDNSYTIFEGSFLTPLPVLDRTINILMYRDPDNHEYQFIINRAVLEEEQTIEEWCQSEMDSLLNRLPGFQIEGKLLKDEIGPAKLSTVQVANRYLNNGKVIRQVQSILRLPQNKHYNPGGRDIIIFTLNAEDEFTEHQRRHYVSVINNFTPDTDD